MDYFAFEQSFVLQIMRFISRFSTGDKYFGASHYYWLVDDKLDMGRYREM